MSPAGTELCSSQVSLLLFVSATDQLSNLDGLVQTRQDYRIDIQESSRFVFDYSKIKNGDRAKQSWGRQELQDR